MIRIAITEAAFEAIADTLPLGSVGYEAEVTADRERLVWFERIARKPTTSITTTMNESPMVRACLRSTSLASPLVSSSISPSSISSKRLRASPPLVKA
jgi:hypothetical protein